MHLNKHIFCSQKLQIYLTYETHFFFFSGNWKFNVDSKNEEKKKKMHLKTYCLLDNLIRIRNGKFSLLLHQYSYLGVNMLTSSPKISDVIKNNFFSLNLAQNDEKVG